MTTEQTTALRESIEEALADLSFALDDAHDEREGRYYATAARKTLNTALKQLEAVLAAPTPCQCRRCRGSHGPTGSTAPGSYGGRRISKIPGGIPMNANERNPTC